MKKTPPIELPEVSLDWLLERVKEDEGGCYIWTGYMAHGGHPQARINYQLVLVRRLVWAKVHGRNPPKELWIGVRCDKHGCVHPNCVVGRSRSVALKGRVMPLAVRARISAARSKNSKFSDADIRAMRTEEGTLQSVATRYGADLSYVWQIRNNMKRREYASPFAGLLAQSGARA